MYHDYEKYDVLVNAIKIKDGKVYLSERVYGVDKKFEYALYSDLTKIYNEQGQLALDTEIIEMILQDFPVNYFIPKRKSVEKYLKVVCSDDAYQIYKTHIDKLNNHHNCDKCPYIDTDFYCCYPEDLYSEICDISKEIAEVCIKENNGFKTYEEQEKYILPLDRYRRQPRKKKRKRKKK